jgi:hypothetical protein
MEQPDTGETHAGDTIDVLVVAMLRACLSTVQHPVEAWDIRDTLHEIVEQSAP